MEASASTSATSSSTSTSAAERPTGLEDVVRSVRTLARRTRDLGVDVADVAERELAMATRVAADLRDRVISRETLADARRNPLAKRLRKDAHEIVDLVVDAGAVSVLTAARFFEQLVDEPRPALPGGTAPAVIAGSGKA